MTTRKYSSRSQQTTLTSAVTSGASIIPVVSATTLLGGASVSAGQTFVVVIDPDTALEEIVEITVVSGNNLTVNRAVDMSGATAQDHSSGAVIRHMVIGRDLREANLHIEATTAYNDGTGTHAMHGILTGEGDVVGTAKTQTLTNKTFISPVLTGTLENDAGITFEGATADAYETTLTVVDPTADRTITLPDATGTIVLKDTTDVLTNKTLTSATLGGNLAAGGYKITDLGTPTAGTDAVTKTYADANVAAAATSATSAAASATAAATSASSAATSATSAAASVSSIAGYATTASNSASAAATSATSAAASATAASTSASSASTSASSALTSQTAASTSATSAAASATAASTSATSAAASATAASTSASSALTSQTAAATSATSAAASATAAATSATSSATSSTAAATSATSAATQATAAATSATSAAASATSAAASAASVNATATLATEFSQYGAEGSVLQNVPTRVHPAENLLKQAVWWIDSAHSGSSGQAIKNLGWGGSALDTTAGSTTAADSNDPQYLAWDGRNYVYLPGVAGNYMTAPDETALDITGDIDIRMYMALDDWTPASAVSIVSKYATPSSSSYLVQIASTGTPYLYWSPDGSTVLSKFSTAVPTIADGAAKWIRVTLDVDNGASGNDVKFFTSDDGTTWTQLGTTVTTAGVTSIFNSSTSLSLGMIGTSSTPMSGKIYRAQILNGIDGVPVLDVDTSVVSTGAATSFTALTGQTVTINRSTSGRKTTCVTHPVWLFGTDDYMEVNNRWLEHALPSANYVYLNGAASNYMSSPDAAALDIVGDIDLRVQVALDDWTPAAQTALVAKDVVSGGQRSYNLGINTTGQLTFVWTTDGSTVIQKFSNVATGVTDGATKWVRVTLDVDNGASGNSVQFFTSDDGTTWTQLGTTQTTAGVTSVYSGTAPLEIGSIGVGTSSNAKGRFYRAQVYNGIAGTLVFDADASIITDGTASTFKERSTNAATVTINKSGTGTFASTNSYLYLPGVAGNYASSPSSSAVNITGDIDLRVKVAMDDWTPSTAIMLISKWDGSNGNQYRLKLETTGQLQFSWSSTGNTFNTVGSSANLTNADGSISWVRVTFDVDNGASGSTATFFTSPDGTTWTQFGTTNVTAGIATIFSGSAILEIGSQASGTVLPARGKFFRAQVLNGIGGTVAFDANFESSIVGNLPTTFTEGSTNAATVTVNYLGTAYRSAGVIASTYVYPGATNTFKLSAYSLLDFGATDDLTTFIVGRKWATKSTGLWFYKSTGTAVGDRGWFIQDNSSGLISDRFGDGAIRVVAGPDGTSYSTGGLVTRAEVRSVSSDNFTPYLNGTAQTVSSDTTTGSLASYATNLTVGSSGFSDFEIIAAAVFRRALTAGEITTLNSYFQGRVA